MFTGLITDLGTVERLLAGSVAEITIASHFSEPFALGESIACNGVCLTVVGFDGPRFRVQAAPETLRRTTVGRWQPGTCVNLERALKVGDRLGGHWVQGHVDAVGQVLDVRSEGASKVLTVSLPHELGRLCVEKGSMCIDGVSLTVTHVASGRFSVMLIPQTQSATTLGGKRLQDPVNLEVDIIGKYVARMMAGREGLTAAHLAAAGFATE